VVDEVVVDTGGVIVVVGVGVLVGVGVVGTTGITTVVTVGATTGTRTRSGGRSGCKKTNPPLPGVLLRTATVFVGVAVLLVFAPDAVAAAFTVLVSVVSEITLVVDCTLRTATNAASP
jgi:hypothetical protein